MSGAVCAVLLVLAVTVLWPAAVAAQTAAGVVTRLVGNAAVARPTGREPLSLKFKDEVFVRDKVSTGEESMIRMLLGGKAVLSVRELSTVLITEEVGRSTVDVDAGKIGLAVARQRMSPGEVIDIRTPNALVTVRGTTLIVEIVSAGPAAAAGQAAVTTNVHVLSGSAEVLLRTARGAAPTTIAPGLSLTIAGHAIGQPRPSPPRGEIVRGLTAAPAPLTPPQELRANLRSAETARAAALASTLVPTPRAGLAAPRHSAPRVTRPADASAEVIPTSRNRLPTASSPNAPPPPKPPTTTPGNIIVNPSFEIGSFAGWSVEGAGAVVSTSDPLVDERFRGFPDPDGNFFAIVHTGDGAVSLPSCGAGRVCQRSRLRQTFQAQSALLVRFRALLVSNEFPSFTASASEFRDTFTVDILAGGQPVRLFETNVNQQHGNFLPASESSSGAGFTIDQGAGRVDFGMISKTVVVPGGPATIVFTISDVSDDALDSAIFIDPVVITQDPPLYFVGDGSRIVSPWAEPLLRLNGGSHAFDSLLMVCCGSSVELGGPVLHATDSILDVPFSLVSVLQGGSVMTTAREPLVLLEGGRYALGSEVALFDIAGVNAAADRASGLRVGTDTPLQHAGVLLEARGAAITTRSVVKVDTAVLEASRPVLNLLAGSRLATHGPLIDVLTAARVSSVGPIANLVGSALASAGPLVSVRSGVFSGAGSLFTLSGGSVIDAPLVASIAGGGLFSWTGPLASFGGSGNAVNLRNSLCAANSCITTAGGLRVALQAGAVAANVAVSNPTPWVGLGTGGVVNMPSQAAHFLLTGPSSRLSLTR